MDGFYFNPGITMIITLKPPAQTKSYNHKKLPYPANIIQIVFLACQTFIER